MKTIYSRGAIVRVRSWREYLLDVRGTQYPQRDYPLAIKHFENSISRARLKAFAKPSRQRKKGPLVRFGGRVR